MISKYTAAVVLLAGATPALAQNAWEIRGSSTTRFSDYNNSGNVVASPNPFTGGMAYNDFNIFAENKDTSYSSWNSEISGVINPNDDYRTRNNGFIPERINLTREDGTNSIPFRIEAGDFFSYYSYMTLQRSLKGVQVELQPFTSNQRQHSILISSGSSQNDWRDFSTNEDYYNAISWMVSDNTLGNWGLSYVNNNREGNSIYGTLDRNQSTLSLAGNLPLSFAGQNLTVESEIASFRGDHNGLFGAASGQGMSDEAYRMELQGRDENSPLEYRFKFEQYGQDYRPSGAIVIADRRLSEGRAGWLFDNGLRLQARTQKTEDGFETSNSFNTRTVGINLSGLPLDDIYAGLNTRIDAYIQNNNNKLNTVSYGSTTITLNMDAPVTSKVSGRLNAYIQDLDSRINNNQNTKVSQLSLALDIPLAIVGFNGFMSSGMTMRRNDTWQGERDEFSPVLSFQLSRRFHSLRFNYGGMFQNRNYTNNGLDVDTQNFGLDYRYNTGKHSFGLEATSFQRNPKPGAETNAWVASAYWTYQFDRQAPSRAFIASSAATPSASGAGSFAIDITGLAPGLRASRAETQLLDANIENASIQSGMLVYETRVLPNVFQRQRLVVEYVAGVLKQSAVIIEFDDVGDSRDMQQIYDNIQQQLINEYGRPVRTYAEGDFGPTLAQSLNSDRFMRINEWTTSAGTLRFGIPRRLDGQIRMEIQHTQVSQPSANSLWSIESIR